MLKPFYFQMAVKSAETKAASNGSSERVVIKGFASTPDLDRYRDIVEPEAFKDALALYMKNPTLLRSHDSDQAAGTVTMAQVTEKGLWIEAEVIDEEMKAEVLDGRRRALSIGYIPLETEMKIQRDDGSLREFNWEEDSYWDPKVVRVIKRVDLVEISLVTTPANGHALFTVEKSVKECLNSLSVKSFMKTKKQAENVPAEIKHVVTEEDLKANPELVTAGVKVGDTIGLPAPTMKKDAAAEETKEEAKEDEKTEETEAEEKAEATEDAENQETGSDDDEGDDSEEEKAAEGSDAEADKGAEAEDEAKDEDAEEETEGEDDEAADEGESDADATKKAIAVSFLSLAKATGVKIPKDVAEQFKGYEAVDLPKDVVPLMKALLSEVGAKGAQVAELEAKLSATPTKKALAVHGQFREEEAEGKKADEAEETKDGKPSKQFGMALRSILGGAK